MIRKEVVFAVLVACCLCSLIFTVLPIRSGNPYDPWIDLDESGRIDMKDIASVAKAFGASGDPTKNVTVTNWPIQSDQYEVRYLGRYNISYGWCDVQGYCGGFSKMTVHLHILNYSGVMGGGAVPYITGNITAHELRWYISPDDAQNRWNNGFNGIIDSSVPFDLILHHGEGINYWEEHTVPIETKAPYFTFSFSLQLSSPPSSYWILFDAYAYLRND